MKTVAERLAPGAIFKRIINKLHECQTELHLDGSPDYQRGFSEGFRAATRVVESEEGNLACEITALRHREQREEAKKHEA